MSINLQGHVFNGAGVAVNGATVDIFTVATAADQTTSSASATASTTTDDTGLWTSSGLAEGLYDVRITSGTEIRWLRYEDRIQLDTIDVANLRVRNPANTFEYDIVPAAIVADRTLNLPLLTATGTLIATPSVEDLDMGGFDVDNAGFVIFNAAAAPAGTEVYLVNDNTGDLTLNALSTKTINFAIAGTDEVTLSATVLSPTTTDGMALGSGTLMWADLFLASGSVVNWDNGDVTLTHGAGHLSMSADLFLASGSVVNWDNGDVTLTHGAGHLSMSADKFFIGDTANAGLTVGMTILSTNADEVFALKHGNVAHGLTSHGETDTYFSLRVNTDGGGGVTLRSLTEDAADAINLSIEAYGGTANTAKTTSASALIDVLATEISGGARADITADGNVFLIRARVGSSNVVRMLVDKDGDVHAVVSPITAFDAENDVGLVRAFERARTGKGIIHSKWDQFVDQNEADLVRVGVLGAPVAEGGLWNITQHMRLLNGAVWQLGEGQYGQDERIQRVEETLEILRDQVKALGAAPEA